MRKWVALHILFVLAAPFATTIHNAFPHQEEEASCPHPGRSLHLEKDESDSNASPCIFCAHHGSRSAAPLFPIRLVESQIALRAPALPEAFLSDPLTLLAPDSRGPPAGL